MHAALPVFVIALCAALAPAAHAQEPLSFIAIGDIPYDRWNDAGTEVTDGAQSRMLAERIAPAVSDAVASGAAPFILHYGDFKAGGGPCTDRLVAERLDGIAALAPGRVVYTPGDNDWTDCDRDGTGKPMSELERLAHLRQAAYRDREMAAALDVARQPLYPENARWRHGRVLFASLHVVGTNNGREQILRDDDDLALARVAARDQANRVWLDHLFDRARAEETAAVVVVFQADIFRSRGNVCTALSRRACDGHAWLRAHLERKAVDWGKPVLVVHGDTSAHCLDRPLGRVPNLWRLNGPGDYLVLDAERVTVDPSDAERPFKSEGVLSGDPPPSVCLP